MYAIYTLRQQEKEGQQMNTNYKHLKLACYATNLSMSVVANLSPILFLTFRSLYGISYSLIGLLVLINFCTQLSMDLLLSFFSHKFNIPKVVRFTPILTFIGLLIFGVWPFLFPGAVYPGLVIGTVIYSASGGFGEVLISPVIASIPAKDPDREMSKLHSVYAWGVVLMVLICTVFIWLFGEKNWQWLIFLLLLIPATGAVLFAGADIPSMRTPKKASGTISLLKSPGIWLCIGAMFFSGASECTMGQWASGYLEQALHIPKIIGDIFGVALFSVMLGLGRSLYGKIGKNIGRVLCFGAVGAVFCYLIAAVTPIPAIGLFACALTGFCTSMLWPGSLVVASERFPAGGVFIYAMMAAAGDFGASVGPQLVGIITDAVAASPALSTVAQNLTLAPEQLGMKIGMLVGMLFPLLSIPLYYRIWKGKAKK